MQTTQVQATPGDRAAFEAVSGGVETTSAGTLLVVAYLVMWALLAGFILLSWRRVGRVETRIAGLERALQSGPSADK